MIRDKEFLQLVHMIEFIVHQNEPGRLPYGPLSVVILMYLVVNQVSFFWLLVSLPISPIWKACIATQKRFFALQGPCYHFLENSPVEFMHCSREILAAEELIYHINIFPERMKKICILLTQYLQSSIMQRNLPFFFLSSEYIVSRYWFLLSC